MKKKEKKIDEIERKYSAKEKAAQYMEKMRSAHKSKSKVRHTHSDQRNTLSAQEIEEYDR